MKKQIIELLTTCGYEVFTEMQNSICLQKEDTYISIYDDRLLVSGSAEHTIDTRRMDDPQDVVMVLHALGLIDWAEGFKTLELTPRVPTKATDMIMGEPADNWPCWARNAGLVRAWIRERA